MSVMGGRNLGVARGSIEIDVTALTQAAAQARAAAQTMESALNKAGATAERTESRFKRLGRTFASLRGELTAVGIAAAGLTAIGVRYAANLEAAAVQLKGIAGGVAEANRLMKQLDATANDLNLPFRAVITASRMLLPSLEGNTQELERWLDLVRRVSTLAPEQGFAGAAFAVREAMASGGTDLMSLVERFQIERGRLRQALEESGGDFAAALDKVLIKMGVTTQSADEMGETFQRSLTLATEEFQRLLGEGMQPFLDELTPVLKSMREWLKAQREINPEFGKTAAGLTLIAAAGVPLILVLEKIVGLFGMLGAAKGFTALLGLLGTGVATSALLGGGLGLGLGIGGVGAVGRLTGDEQLENFGLDDIVDFFKNEWPNQFRASLYGAGIGLSQVTDADRALTTPQGTTSQAGRDFWDNLWRDNIPAATGGVGASGGDSRFTPKRVDIMVKWQQDILEIEENAAEERLRTTEQFERQRADKVREFGQRMAREAEDFARQRARAEDDFRMAVANAREDSAERERLANEDFNRKVANIREQHGQRMLDIEQQFADRREDLIDGHRDRILKAAARGDALAVLEENRRFALAMKKLARDEKRRTDKQDASTDERIDNETEAHQIRLERAREADAERLRDMERDFELRKQREDEDRVLRLERMRQDHNDQLTEMASVHDRRIQQINDDAAAEKIERDRLFQEQLHEEGLATEAFKAEWKQRRDDAKAAFTEFWDHIMKTILPPQRTSASEPRDENDTRRHIPFADGGFVGSTSRALLHSGEYVLNSKTTEQLRAMMGNFAQPDLVRAVGGQGGGNRSVSVSMAPGTIVVHGAEQPSQTADEIAGMLTQLFRSIA